jgi:hypothetical protein
MMDAITIFGKNSFIFSCVGYELVIKLLEARCTFEKVEVERECQNMNVNFFPTKLG